MRNTVRRLGTLINTVVVCSLKKFLVIKPSSCSFKWLKFENRGYHTHWFCSYLITIESLNVNLIVWKTRSLCLTGILLSVVFKANIVTWWHVLFIGFETFNRVHNMCFRSCARERQWCGIIHYYCWTASIKLRLLFSRAGYAFWGLSLSSV